MFELHEPRKMSETVTLKVTDVNGEPTLTGLIGLKEAAEICNCSQTTIRTAVTEGNIRRLWMSFDQPSKFRMLYRVDVLKFNKARNIKPIERTSHE